MNEQNNIPRLQMNRELKSVTADITLEPDARREAYRLSNRLAQKMIEGENKRRLADALGYTDVAPMLAGIEALTDMVIPVQRAFGDNKVTCIKREDEDADTSPQSNSAWLEQARARWRRFELTATGHRAGWRTEPYHQRAWPDPARLGCHYGKPPSPS